MKSICIYTYSIYTYGGIQRCVCLLANQLVNKGYSVSIICSSNEGKKLFDLDERINVYHTSKMSIMNRIVDFIPRIFRKMDQKIGLFRNCISIQKFIYFGVNYTRNNSLIQILKDISPDYVIGTAENALMLANLSNRIDAKIIGWQHSSCESYFDYLFKYQIKMYQSFLKEFHEYIVLTHCDKIWLKDRFNFKCKYIYNFKSFTTEKKSDLTHKNMIAVGRLHEAKNYELLISAFKIFVEKNPEWKLNIYGDGEERVKLADMILKTGLKESVFLNSSISNISDKYLESSIFVICSKREGFGLVVIEAFECGLPVIASNLPAFRELISEKEGIVIGNNDAETLANAMGLMASSPKKMKEYGENAKIKSRQFDNESIVYQWMQILR